MDSYGFILINMDSSQRSDFSPKIRVESAQVEFYENLSGTFALFCF